MSDNPPQNVNEGIEPYKPPQELIDPQFGFTGKPSPMVDREEFEIMREEPWEVREATRLAVKFAVEAEQRGIKAMWNMPNVDTTFSNRGSIGRKEVGYPQIRKIAKSMAQNIISEINNGESESNPVNAEKDAIALHKIDTWLGKIDPDEGTDAYFKEKVLRAEFLVTNAVLGRVEKKQLGNGVIQREMVDDGRRRVNRNAPPHPLIQNFEEDNKQDEMGVLFLKKSLLPYWENAQKDANNLNDEDWRQKYQSNRDSAINFTKEEALSVDRARLLVRCYENTLQNFFDYNLNSNENPNN